MPAPALRQVESRQHWDRKGETGRRYPCHGRIARQRDEHHKTERCKQELSNCLHQDINNDARRRKRTWYGPEC